MKLLCDTTEEAGQVRSVIGNMRRVLLLKSESLEKTSISPVLIDELMLLKEWYTDWKRTEEAELKSVSDVLTIKVWEDFCLSKSQEEIERKEQERVEEVQIKKEAALDTARLSVGEKKEGLNVSYKVETKEIPKLPPNKSLKGKLFDDWHASFYVKMCQAQLDDILEEGSMAGVLGSVYEVDPDMFIDFEIDKSATVAYMKESLSLNYKFEGVKIWFEEPPDLIVVKMREHFGSLGRPPGYIHYRQ